MDTDEKIVSANTFLNKEKIWIGSNLVKHLKEVLGKTQFKCAYILCHRLFYQDNTILKSIKQLLADYNSEVSIILVPIGCPPLEFIQKSQIMSLSQRSNEVLLLSLGYNGICEIAKQISIILHKGVVKSLINISIIHEINSTSTKYSVQYIPFSIKVIPISLSQATDEEEKEKYKIEEIKETSELYLSVINLINKIIEVSLIYSISSTDSDIFSKWISTLCKNITPLYLQENELNLSNNNSMKILYQKYKILKMIIIKSNYTNYNILKYISEVVYQETLHLINKEENNNSLLLKYNIIITIIPSYYRLLFQNSINARIIASVIQSVTPSLRGLSEESDMVEKGFEAWLISIGFMNKLEDVIPGIEESDLVRIANKLVENVAFIETSKHLRMEFTVDSIKDVLKRSFQVHF